jgi:hypothetical protein
MTSGGKILFVLSGALPEASIQVNTHASCFKPSGGTVTG